MILSLLLLPSLALSALGQGFARAPVITNNPPTTYTATLFNNPSTSIRGEITASGAPGGVGVVFRVNFTGLPANIGPFPYHVHLLPVPANGDCNATGEHLDPYNRGEQPPCDPSDPATCQVGDLSDKHGPASGNVFSAEYTDLYLSTDPSSNAFIGNRAIVIHNSADVRLNCGNLQLVSGSPGTRPSSTRAPSGSPTSTHTSSTHPTSTVTPSNPPTSTHTSSSRPTSTELSTIPPTSTHTFSTRPTSTETSTIPPTSTHTFSTRPTSTTTPSNPPTSTHTSSIRPTTTSATITRSIPIQPTTFSTRPVISTR